MAHRLVCVFGGSGFVGRHLVRRLANSGDRVRVAVRDPEGAHFLKPLGNVGQIVAVPCNLGHEGSVNSAVAGADAVVNLVATLNSSGRQNFQTLHVDGAAAIAAAAGAAGAKSLVHLSALGADAGSRSAYARSKAAGEEAVHAAFPGAVILRPSVIFGPEDKLFNRFATLSGISPILPAVGAARFQPVYVADVADAIMAGLGNPAHAGQTFSLGGPRAYSMREIMEIVLAETGRRRLILPEPLWLAALQSVFLQFVPGPMKLTPDQVRLMAVDNVVPEGAPGLAALGISPTSVESIVPTYLARFRNPYAPRQPRIAR